MSTSTTLRGPRVRLRAATPEDLRRRGAGMDVVCGFADSPFGRCMVGWSARGILQFSFVDPGEDDARVSELRKRWPGGRMRRDDAAARRLAERIFARSGTPVPAPRFRVFVRGTPFQMRVWRKLLQVRPGTTISYGALAARAGRPGAARAAGTAMAANPVAFLVPCHRVLREGGAPGGYRWGAARKRAMLAWEGAGSSNEGKHP